MNPKKIENLKKIKILVEAGTKPDLMNLSSEPFSYEFIFGIGSNGLTPFEYDLVDKPEASSISILVEQNKVHELFEHIVLPWPEIVSKYDKFYLNIKIDKISEPSSTEVVKAMSALAGGGCGCGCGGHGSDSQCDNQSCDPMGLRSCGCSH